MINQPMTKEQIEEQEAFNRAAQFHYKGNSLCHQPAAQQLDSPKHQLVSPDKDANGRQGFDDAEHRAFMRSLG